MATTVIVLKKPQPLADPAAMSLLPSLVESETGKKRRRPKKKPRNKRTRQSDNNIDKKLKHNDFERSRRERVSSAIDKAFCKHLALFSKYRYLSSVTDDQAELSKQASKEKQTTESKILFVVSVATFLEPLFERLIVPAVPSQPTTTSVALVEKKTTVTTHYHDETITHSTSPPPLHLSLAGYTGNVAAAFLYSPQCCFLDGNLRFHSLFRSRRLTVGVPVFELLTIGEKDRLSLLADAKHVLEDSLTPLVNQHWSISKEMFIHANNETWKAVFTIKRYMIISKNANAKEEENNLFSFGCLHVEVYLKPYAAVVDCSEKEKKYSLFNI